MSLPAPHTLYAACTAALLSLTHEPEGKAHEQYHGDSADDKHAQSVRTSLPIMFRRNSCPLLAGESGFAFGSNFGSAPAINQAS